jgi:LemA protein
MLFELLLVLGVVLLYVIILYNRLISARESVRNDLKQIDIQLDRRYKVFESLISAVSKYMKYEETVLKDVVSLRSQAQSARESGDVENRVAAENAISKIAGGLNVMVEAYPDLKASNNVGQLMEEIVSTENKLSFAKQAYNDGSERFNAMVLSFPANIIIGVFGDQFVSFVYWQLDKEDAKSKEDYIAKL